MNTSVNNEERRAHLQSRLYKVRDLIETAKGKYSITTPGTGKRQVVLDDELNKHVEQILSTMQEEIIEEIAAIDNPTPIVPAHEHSNDQEPTTESTSFILGEDNGSIAND